MEIFESVSPAARVLLRSFYGVHFQMLGCRSVITRPSTLSSIVQLPAEHHFAGMTQMAVGTVVSSLDKTLRADDTAYPLATHENSVQAEVISGRGSCAQTLNIFLSDQIRAISQLANMGATVRTEQRRFPFAFVSR